MRRLYTPWSRDISRLVRRVLSPKRSPPTMVPSERYVQVDLTLMA